MRMWMVDPALMCRKHLLGEHVEIHMLVGSLERGTSLDGFIENGLLEPAAIRRRHNEIVREMTRRGYSHKSPLPDPVLVPIKYMTAKVDIEKSLADLVKRCPGCANQVRNKV